MLPDLPNLKLPLVLISMLMARLMRLERRFDWASVRSAMSAMTCSAILRTFSLNFSSEKGVGRDFAAE